MTARPKPDVMTESVRTTESVRSPPARGEASPEQCAHPSVRPRRVAGTDGRDECRSACRPHYPRGRRRAADARAGHILMTLDSSVMNVAIATVAKDVGTTVTGIQS